MLDPLQMLMRWLSNSSAAVGSVEARSAPTHTHTPAQVGLTMQAVSYSRRNLIRLMGFLVGV